MILETLLSEEQFAELDQDINKLTNDLDKANSEHAVYLELNSQYCQNKEEIAVLKTKQITTRDLIEKIYQEEKKYSRLLSRRRYFLDELEIRGKAIEKYSDKRGYLLTKAERKEKDDIERQLEPLTKLKNELDTKNKTNENIKKSISELEQVNRGLIVKFKELSTDSKILLSQIETIKSKLHYLQTFQKNQLLLKKCIPIIKEKHISIDDEDDYDDVKNKCILHYADSLKYEGPMYPLCLNETCSGVNIGYPCSCGENSNIWFTLNKPKLYENYITVEYNELFPELNQPLGYLVTRDCSIDKYLECADEHDIDYSNYNELFIEVNTHHHDMLRNTYCVPCKDYPKSYNNYESDEECDENCYFDINSGGWICDCGHRQFVWDDHEFDPMKHSILNTIPEGSLRNDY